MRLREGGRDRGTSELGRQNGRKGGREGLRQGRRRDSDVSELVRQSEIDGGWREGWSVHL